MTSLEPQFRRWPIAAVLAATVASTALTAGRGAWARGSEQQPPAAARIGPGAPSQLPPSALGKAHGKAVLERADILDVLLEVPGAGGVQRTRGTAGLATLLDLATGAHVATPAQATVSSCDASTYCRSQAAHSKCYVAKFTEVEWQFCAVDKQRRGLWIEHVTLKRDVHSVLSKPIDVLYEAGVMELFVPYHNGLSRANDTLYCTAAGNCQRTLDAAWAGPLGEVNDFDSAGPNGSSVAWEVRDRGLAHLCTGKYGSDVRRGQELAVWAVFDPGNYDNIMEYTFRDDGSIGFRSGVTGYNNPGFDTDAHMHNTLWRVDVDLNGFGADTTFLSQHTETGLTAVDADSPFGVGHESVATWDPLAFSTMKVEDAATNAYGHPIGYVLEPWRTGTARHDASDAAWTNMDFAVSRWRRNEPNTADDAHSPPDAYLFGGASGVLNGESIAQSDIVLWHVSSAHHDPRDEDRSSADLQAYQASGTSQTQGITGVHWSGFNLVPHDVFDFNPLGGPSKCGP